MSHGNIRYPIPENFIEEFNAIPNCTIKFFETKYGVSTATVKRWAAEANVNFHKSNASLEEIYGGETVKKWILSLSSPAETNMFCKEKGFGKDKLKGAAKRLGLPYEHLLGKTLIESPRKEELEQYITSGKTDREIQEIYGVNNPVLKRWYREYGITRKPYEGTIREIPSYEIIFDLHIEKEMTINEIAERLKTSTTKVKEWIDHHKIDLNFYRKKRTYWPTKEEFIDLHVNKKMPFNAIAKLIGVSDVQIGNIAEQYGIENIPYGIGQESEQELKLLAFIQEFFPNAHKINLADSLKINKRKETVSYDICIPEKSIIIEYNGIKFHSEEYGSYPRRHLDKMNLAHHHGYQIINIYSDEWLNKPDIVKSIIKAKLGINNRIYARKTFIKKISSREASDFYNVNHIQGKSNHYHSSYGLFINDELVAAMSFGSHHRINEYDGIILKRFANKLNHNVIGGASKLFKFAIENENYSTIISWSDNRWSNGDLYKKLGFTQDGTLGIRYDYVIKGCIRKPAQQFTKKKIGCPPHISERDFLKEQKIYRIWDCGKIRWKWQKEA